MFSGPGLLAGRQTLGRGSLGTGLWQSPSPPPGALAGLESSVLSPPSMLDNVSAPSCWALTVGHISTRHACTVGSSTNKSLKGAKDGIRAQLLWPLAWLCPAGCHCLPQASFPTGGHKMLVPSFPSVHVDSILLSCLCRCPRTPCPLGRPQSSAPLLTQSVTPGPWFSWNTQPHIRALISSPFARDSPRSAHSSQGCPLISASWQAFLSELTSPYPWAI